MSIFKQTLLAAVLCGAFGVAAAAPDDTYYGNSSNRDNVRPGQSDAIPFGAGKAGLRFVNGGNWSASINLENGPVQHIRAKYNDRNKTPIPINGTDVRRRQLLPELAAAFAPPPRRKLYQLLHKFIPV